MIFPNRSHVHLVMVPIHLFATNQLSQASIFRNASCCGTDSGACCGADSGVLLWYQFRCATRNAKSCRTCFRSAFASACATCRRCSGMCRVDRLLGTCFSRSANLTRYCSCSHSLFPTCSRQLTKRNVSIRSSQSDTTWATASAGVRGCGALDWWPKLSPALFHASCHAAFYSCPH
jgi:hypothetical protein